MFITNFPHFHILDISYSYALYSHLNHLHEYELFHKYYFILYRKFLRLHVNSREAQKNGEKDVH